MILKANKLTKNYGQLCAVNEVSLEIEEGEKRAIIGPNGAGKTTLMDLINNSTRPTSGRVYFKDKDITRLPPYTVARLGIVKCSQVSKLFPELTVFENIQIACISRWSKVYNMYTPGNNIFHSKVTSILNSIGLSAMAGEFANYLSYGDQRRLEIGIALAMQPILLLLDEPTAGISRKESDEVMHLISELASERALTVVFIEHDINVVFNYADKVTVMHQGKIIANDTPKVVRNDRLVQQVYLGEKIP